MGSTHRLRFLPCVMKAIAAVSTKAAETKADRNVNNLQSFILLVVKRMIGVTVSTVIGVQIAMKTKICTGSPMASSLRL